VNKELNLDTT